jgi:hypothetical protein
MANTHFTGPVFSANGFVGSITGAVVGTTTGIDIASIQLLSGPGAVDVINATTELTTTGAAQALTLIDGVSGQFKNVVHTVDGGSAVLTPTTKTGFATITFTNVGDSIFLQYHTTRGWMVVSNYNTTIA